MREELRRELDSFGFGPSLLQAALRRFPKKMWCYQPCGDRWSIHDTVIHLADSEASSYVRCRQFIADPGSTDLKFDGRRWARSLHYFEQSALGAIQVIFQLRKSTHSLLSSLPDHLWDNAVVDAALGSITLKRWMTIQERHIPGHIVQMSENYNAWIATHRFRKSATAHWNAPQQLPKPNSAG
jgi:DinB superfamily